MDALRLFSAPWGVARTLMQALDDLHAVAEHGRGQPDRLQVASDRLDTLSTQMDTLSPVARSLEGQSQEIIDGGRELTEAAEQIASSLEAVRGALPGLLHGMRAVEGLEDSVDTVAETVEPLQGLTRGVGRVSARLARAD